MSDLVVLVIEDEPEVRAALVRDLEAAFTTVRVDQAADVDDALAAMAEADDAGDVVGLILADHRLPGRSGVDLLVELHERDDTRHIRKVLVTGQADQQDTIRAVNEAGLDHYIAKPWDPADLVRVVVDELTDFVVETGLDPLAHMRDLDAARLAAAFAARGRPE
ncbi:MAG: response regulator [Ilumatobacter sp.]|nr:response regulator [Ilumatobacter sp.]